MFNILLSQGQVLRFCTWCSSAKQIDDKCRGLSWKLNFCAEGACTRGLVSKLIHKEKELEETFSFPKKLSRAIVFVGGLVGWDPYIVSLTMEKCEFQEAN